MATPSYAPEVTGVGRYAGELARGLVARGFEVDVVCPPPYYPGWYVRAPYRATRYASERLDGVRVFRCPIFIKRDASGLIRLLSSLSFGLSASPILFWRILTRRPDVVLCVEPTIATMPAALIAAKLVRAKTVTHVQDIELDAALAVGHIKLSKGMLRLANGVDRFIKRRFDRVITISTTMMQTLLRKGVDPKRIEIIRNWVDTTQIRPIQQPVGYRAELGLSADQVVCLYSGQIGRKQALHLVLEAARLLENEPRFQFVIAGDGPELPNLKQRFGKLPNVRFLPLQPEERLCEFLNLPDVHVLPQDAGMSELVLPSKLGGMLASGRRILVTAEPEAELSLFLGGSAIIVPPGSATAIVSGLHNVATQSDETASDRLELARSISAENSLDRFAQALRSIVAPAHRRVGGTQPAEE